jgi:hypothetical protein
VDGRALAAIRAGVLAAGVVVQDDPLLPRAFQLRPFKTVHGAKKRAEGLVTPLVRQALWEEQVCQKSGNTKRKLIDTVIERFE